MDTLALVALTIGLLAAIGVVVVAMHEKGTAAAQPASPPLPQQSAVAAPTGPPATSPAPGHKRRRKRYRHAPAGPPARPPAADHVMTAPAEKPPLAPPAMQGADPLLIGLGRQVQLLSDELQKLRQQEEETERRLKLINGIAVLLQEVEGSSLNNGNNVSSSHEK
jgi:hypothetical protein